MSAKLRSIVSAGLQQVDFLLQSRFCLVQPFFVEDLTAAPRAGSYTAGGWDRVRQHQTEPLGSDVDRYASDEDYRQYLSSIHQSKILSVQSLIRAFDFSQFRRIMELGCGDMPQAFIVCSRHPEISYTATDFDPHVIEKCARLPLLSGIRKFVFDVTRDDLDELKNADLVISWSLEFSLEDRDLTAVFAACRKHSVPYLLCTHTDIGPIGYVQRAFLQARQRKRLRDSGMRMIGWLRSTGEIARLARQAGMAMRSRTYHVNHAALLFTPT